MSEQHQIFGEAVAEAVADALLAASAQALILQNPATPAIPIEAARDHAIQMLDRVIERTLREGARPQ